MSQNQQNGWLFDVDKTQKRYRLLDAYHAECGLNADHFSCKCYAECAASKRSADIVKQYSGGTAGLAPFYDASYNGQDIRVLVVGKEAGFINNQLGTAENFYVQTLNNLNCINWSGKNNHIKGTLLTLQRIFQIDTEYVYAAYALSNGFRCAFQDADRADSRSGLPFTATMRKNRLEYLLGEIKILEPTVVILQGAWSIEGKPPFVDRLGAATGHKPIAIKLCKREMWGLYKIGQLMCITSNHPARLAPWLAKMAPLTLWPMIDYLKQTGYLPEIGPIARATAEFEMLVKPEVDKMTVLRPSNDTLRGRKRHSGRSKAVGDAALDLRGIDAVLKKRAVDLSTGVSRGTKAYWVNQKPTNISIWARFKNRDGKSVPHCDRLRGMKPGDLIVHNINRQIRRISRVTAMPIGARRPSDIRDKADPRFEDMGTIVEVESFDFSSPIKLDDFITDLNSLHVQCGPIRSDGRTVVLGYVFNFSREGLAFIKKLAGYEWPEWADCKIER